MALGLGLESVVLSLKTLLKNYPAGINIQEVNHIFVKRFGTALDPLSYNHYTLKDFLQSLANKDKSFVIENEILKLCQSDQNKFGDEIKSLKITRRSEKIRPFQPIIEPLVQVIEAQNDIVRPSFPTSKSLSVIGAFDISFSEDKDDYLTKHDNLPPIELSRAIRKGEILRVKIISIQDPYSFQLRILDPPDLAERQRKMSSFTQRMTHFYLAYKGQKVLQVTKKDFPLDGFVLACPYISSRSGRLEWRRCMVMNRIDLYQFEVYLFDYGVYLTVNFNSLRKLYKPFAHVPMQAIGHVTINIISSYVSC